MWLCGCNLKEKLECSNGIHDGKNWHQILHISRTGKRQKICQIVPMKIRGNILCSRELGGLVCRWNAYHQHLDRIDEMKHLPGAWIWKTFRYCITRSEATRGLLFMSRYCSRKPVGTRLHVFWSLGPLSKTCLLQKRLSLSAVKAMVIFHVHCDRWCLYSCD